MKRSSGILAFLLLIFLVRAMVPAGFMPDVSGAGHLITICTGIESKTISVDESGQPVKEETGQSCPFSFLSSAISGVDLPEFSTVWFRAEFSEPFFEAENAGYPDLYHAGQFVLLHAPPLFS